MSGWGESWHDDGAGGVTRCGFVSETVAVDWEEALISGNGRQGALVYGDPDAVFVTLSHERLFLPMDAPLPAPDTATILPQLRERLFNAHYRDAADQVVRVAREQHPGYAQCRNIDPFIGAATLCFTPAYAGEATGYERLTDFTTGTATQRWRTRAGEVRQDVFVSRTEDVVAVRFLGPVSGRLRLGPIVGQSPVPIETALAAEPDHLRLTARFPGAWQGGVTGYDVTCRVVTDGGIVSVEGTELLVDGSTELLVLARVQVHDGGRHDVGEALDTLLPDFEELQTRHAKVHAELLGRVHLDLGGSTQRFRNVEQILTPEAEPARVEWLFDAGRYAIISSCGDLPPNLQGVWSGTHAPPWRAGYTLDGNLEAAVAALLPTGTPELLLPLFDLLDRFAEDFRENARRLYGAGGILVPAHCSGHGRLNHFNERWCQTFWTAGAAWLARLHYDYWRYTGDTRHLVDRALPFMVEAARFYADFLVDRDGCYVFAPSYSPENDPAGTGSQATVNATMDVAAVRDLLRNLLDTHAVLGRSHPDEARWRHILERLPAYRVADDGTLAEWIWPGLGENHSHRHSSHLFPLWYEPDPLIMEDPRLYAAAVRTVERRWEWWQRKGDEAAFGLVQLGLAAAALGLGETAYEIVQHLADRYWRASLVSTHNAGHIFNVDICGGLPAVVVAMLMRSTRGRLDLLPALPETWPRGEVRGFRARDGITVLRLAWRPSHVEVELVSASDRLLTVGWPSGARPPRIDGADVVDLSADAAMLAVRSNAPASLIIDWAPR